MLILILLLELSTATEAKKAPAASLAVVQPLSKASLPADMFGADWKRPDSLVVDDLGKLDRLSPVHREVVREQNLKPQLEPHGIVGVADYTLVRTRPPINTVTVQAFLFADSAKCEEWWQKKCQYKGWEKDFKKVEGARYQALDAINAKYPNANKRWIKFDRLWISAFQLGDDDKHLKAAEHIIARLTKRDGKGSEAKD